jgi:hypothetical protein
MASLVLGVVGSGVGASLFGSVSFLGATISGAQIGGALGAFLGSQIDAALSPAPHRTGPRLSDTAIQASTEGAAIPRLYGRVRSAGQLIWASQYKESTANQSLGGGKGFGGGGVSETDYVYAISFAVGLCAGATRIGRVWADGNLLDISRFTTRFHTGSETQLPDPLIADIEGADNAPAFRGLAYIVFEDMPLAQFANRIPQLQFEIFHNLSATDPDALENRLGGVALIPGAGEFVYDAAPISDDDQEGATSPQNAHNAAGVADIDASLDELTALAPNLGAVSLVAGWFGSDLRAGSCTLKPGVESAGKITYPTLWSVDGVARLGAHLVSQIDERPAYGGTPSDASIVSAIANLKARGLRVMFCPFVFMDIAPGNTLPDPYTGAGAQPAYPWRGRITCSPAPGVSGSPDQTSAAATQVNAFFGSAVASDFTVTGTTVAWSGGADWGYRRMILHYALLCAASGGVDAFLIGSELRGLTRVRDGAASYPAVAALKTLAAEIRAILGGRTKLGYAADWSEYASHPLGGGALLFNLDPLWSDSNIDFVGIDNYLPLADWRDGTAQADYAPTGPTAIHDRAYLSANIRGGEDYDWYYASDADRAAQTPHPDNRRTRQALGLAREGSLELVEQRALRPPRRHRKWLAHRLGGARQTDLVHRARLPRRRQGREPAQRLRRPQIRRKRLAVFLQRRARRPDPAPLPGGASRLLGRRRQQPGLGALRRPHGRRRQYICVVLGRAALSLLPRPRRRLGRRRQLAPRPLAERPPRRRAADQPRRCIVRRLRRHRGHGPFRPRHRLRRHRHDERPRRAQPPFRRFPFRRRRDPRPDPLRAARPPRRAARERNRPRAPRRRRFVRLLADSGTGNRPAQRLAHLLHRCRRRLPPGQRRNPPPDRLVEPRRDLGATPRDGSGPGHRHRRAAAPGRLGDARDRAAFPTALASGARRHR